MPEFEEPTFNYKFSDKPKNEYSYSEPERGGCLTAFLVFLGIGQVAVILIGFSIFGQLGDYPASSRGILQFASFAQIAVGIIGMACVVGLWNWKSWAYNGMYILYGLGMLLNLFTGQFSGVVGTIIGMAILYYLMKDKTYYLE